MKKFSTKQSVSRLISKDIKEHGAGQSPFLSYMRLLHNLPFASENYKRMTGKDGLQIFKKLYGDRVKVLIKDYLKDRDIKNMTKTICYKDNTFAFAVHIYNKTFKEVMEIEKSLQKQFEGVNVECYEAMYLYAFNTKDTRDKIK
jgi:hypothetical protein